MKELKIFLVNKLNGFGVGCILKVIKCLIKGFKVVFKEEFVFCFEIYLGLCLLFLLVVLV